MILRPYQVELFDRVREAFRVHDRVFMALPTGGGKCLGRGTPVLKYDGSILPVEKIAVGDMLIGPDSDPRTVKTITSGEEELYRVTPIKGDSYVVNKSHILSLKITNICGRVGCSGRMFEAGDIANVSVSEYLDASSTFRHIAKGWRTCVEWQEQEKNLKIDPYFLGLWLGDGTASKLSICTGDDEVKQYLRELAPTIGCKYSEKYNSPNSVMVNLNSIEHGGCKGHPVKNIFKSYNLLENKHIPHDYLITSRENRLQLLAGILDADGCMGHGGFDIVQKRERLADDIVFLARSLGFACYKKECRKQCCNTKKWGTYYRLSISGHCDLIPNKVERRKSPPRKQKKNHLVHGIKVEPLGVGEYFGFELDGPDGLFLLGDFTVTHNTAVFAKMAAGAHAKNRTVWICLPRTELIEQASRALQSLDVPHGRIVAGKKESRAFSLHLVSSNTLIRRWDKIINPPDFIILDEAHIYFDRQLEICERYPNSKIIGVSASPERLDGRGLSDIYQTLIEGPDVRELVELGYLCPVKYYAPPLEGLDTVHRKGLDYDENELAQLFAERKVYGKAVDHYVRHAAGKSTLVFARSVAESEKIAAEFRARGFSFEPISGKTPTKLRKDLLAGLQSGTIHGLVNCELVTYGLDIPRIECLILLRPTMSKALQTQMIGRGLRVSPETKKRECVVLDHVNLIREFGHPFSPYEWQFHGREKRKKAPADPEIRLRLCPETFMYCDKPSCIGCEYNTTKRKTRAEAIVDCQLSEQEAPVPLQTRPVEEQAVFRERLDDAIDRARAAIQDGHIDAGAIGDLLTLARQIGRQPLWVYWRLSEGRLTANVPLLSEIARQEKYKPGWVYFARGKIQETLQRRKKP